MNDPTKKRREADDPTAPPALAKDLTTLYALPEPVPPAVDDAVLSRARRHFAHRRRLRTVLRRLRVGAAAAAIVLAVLLADPFGPAAPAIREDVDGNGQVDILDAFTLARRIEQSPPADPGLDMNGDGVVDRRDVDAIAVAAVRLGGGVVQ